RASSARNGSSSFRKRSISCQASRSTIAQLGFVQRIPPSGDAVRSPLSGFSWAVIRPRLESIPVQGTGGCTAEPGRHPPKTSLTAPRWGRGREGTNYDVKSWEGPAAGSRYTGSNYEDSTPKALSALAIGQLAPLSTTAPWAAAA